MCSSQKKPQMTWREQLFQQLPLWIQRFFVLKPKTQFIKEVKKNQEMLHSLNLRAWFEQKELNQSIIKSIQAANKFKTAIKNNQKIMHYLNNDPHKFLFGASSSSYQYEGGLDDYNANAVFYRAKKWPLAEDAIDFWNRYEGDIKQMKKELGINAFRLSIAWERIQPKRTQDLRQDMTNKYLDIVKKLKENGIEPIIVLHHYTIPGWFADLGGFENKNNIVFFVNFAKKMYTALHEHVTYWSTFNAIEGYAFKGYYTLDGPPGTKRSLFTTQKVMYNMLSAHGQIYDAIKNIYNSYKNNPKIPIPLIGLQKNIIPFDPFDEAESCEKIPTISRQWEVPLKNKISQFICSFSTLINDTIFFKFLHRTYRNKLDWIGLNYHSNMIMKGTKPLEEQDEYRKTKNITYRDYPEGMYRSLQIINDNVAKPLNIPIIITENGIATDNDEIGNKKRERFFRRTLYVIRKRIEEGYPIIGYKPWASHDNYEWPSTKQPDPYNRPYGFFEVKFKEKKDSPDYLKRTLKTGAEYYRDFIKHYFDPEYKKEIKESP